MAYTTINKSTDYFNTKLYTGDGTSSRSQTGVGFQPDLVWIKRRSNPASHTLFDAVRTAGSTKGIASNSTAQEGLTATEGTTANYGYINSFDSDGFTTSNGAISGGFVNQSSETYASWNWKANGQGSANTDGSISSTVSANTTAGFSIVKYTGNLTSGANIGHGLGVKPAMIIIKNLDATESWLCYHTSLGATKHIKLNVTEAAGTATSRFNDTEPTTSLFTVGNDPQTNGNSNDMIAYCFTEKKGFSKFGSYTGNGSTDGTFVYTGFKPAFLIQKRSDISANWNMYDNKRSSSGGFNVVDDLFYVDGSNAEISYTSVDFLSNGFKFRSADGAINGSGNNIFMAFAEAPLVGTNNIPATTR